MEDRNNCPAMVSPLMIAWATSRSDLSLEDLDAKIGKHPGTVASWIDGTGLTVSEALDLAMACRVNFTALFLPGPPAEPGPLEIQEALEIVLEWAHEGIAEEERMRGGRDAFIRRHGERDYDAVTMVDSFIKGRSYAGWMP
jgi:hypothetical protein